MDFGLFCVCVRLRVLCCGVVWLHALFPGLFGCFPAPRFPADCSMVQACAVLFYCRDFCF